MVSAKHVWQPRVLFQNFFGKLPDEFAAMCYGGDLPTKPVVRTPAFMTDEKNKRSIVCFVGDMQLKSTDTPYVKKIRTELWTHMDTL